MKPPLFRSLVVALPILCGLGILSGCATQPEPKSEARAREEYRFLYPRQYLDSLDRHEREDEERRLMAEEMRRDRQQ